jgi:hypothetical protein
MVAFGDFDRGSLDGDVGHNGSVGDAVAQFVFETCGYRSGRISASEDDHAPVRREVLGRIVDGQPVAVEGDFFVDNATRMSTLDAGLKVLERDLVRGRLGQ